jgi:threonine/homoserine/homoserine lactone efflux protein
MLASVAAMWLAAVAIPGPNFFLVARIAARHGRLPALTAVAAIGAGSLCWSLAGFFGVHALFTLAPRLYMALKLAGAAYLIVLGLRILLTRHAEPQADTRTGSPFRLGLVTSLSNPKSALLVGSLFAALMPQGAPLSVGLVTVAEMLAISLLWYGSVAYLVSTGPITAAYTAARRWIDRLAGAIFIGFGAKLIGSQ